MQHIKNSHMLILALLFSPCIAAMLSGLVIPLAYPVTYNLSGVQHAIHTMLIWNMLLAIPFTSFVYAMHACRSHNLFAYIGILVIFALLAIIFDPSFQTLHIFLIKGIFNAIIFGTIFWGIAFSSKNEINETQTIRDEALDNLVHLLQASEIDSALRSWLRSLIRLPLSERRLAIFEALDSLRLKQAPKEIRQALMLLVDNNVVARISHIII